MEEARGPSAPLVALGSDKSCWDVLGIGKGPTRRFARGNPKEGRRRVGEETPPPPSAYANMTG